jgi:hypothetical protein
MSRPDLDQAPERFEGEGKELKVKKGRPKHRSTEGLLNKGSLSLLY